MPKITFGKFDGSLQDDGVKVIFVDGVEVGHIERQVVWDYRGARTGTEGKVVGYTIELLDEALQEKHCHVPSASSVGGWTPRDFKTLGEVQRAVRAIYATKQSAQCLDHWHCDPSLAAHKCWEIDRKYPCPSCGEKPEVL